MSRDKSSRLEGAEFLIEEMSDGVLIIDESGVILLANRAAERLFGKTKSRLIGRPFGFPAVAAEVSRIQLVSGKDVLSVEMKASEIVWNGKAAHLACLRDITERTQIFEARNQLAVIVESSNDAISSRDLNDVVLTWNKAAEKLYGYKAAEIVGQSIRKIIPADLLDEYERGRKRFLAGGHVKNVETRRLRRDGTLVPVSLTHSPIFSPDGVVVGVCTIARDLSEKIESQRLLEESESRFRRLSENAPDIIIHRKVHPALTVEYVNPAIEAILGFTPEEYRAAPDVTLRAHPDDRALLEDIYLRRHPPQGPIVARVFHKDGRTVWLGINFKAQFDERGEVVAYEAIARDVTQRVALEEQLRQAQKVEALGRLAGGVAHDFNNILTVISGFVELTSQRLKAGDPILDDIREIGDATRRAEGLTRQLLTFSRRNVTAPRVLNLNGILGNMQKMLARLIGEDVELRTDLDPLLGNVRIDAGSIEQVIVNLVVNARDAMPRGGKISIATRNERLGEQEARRLGGAVKGPFVVMTVADTGEGMDARTLERIFDPFFTTKKKGTGLGLATVDGIVKQSGGCIAVDSEPGVGTTFRIHLPRVDALVEAAAAAGPAAHVPGVETILLVEDETALRSMAARMLKQNGYKVLEAASGAEAVLLCERNEEPIHLVITDVVMPGMGGRELSARILAMRPGLKVLYMSGYTDDAVLLRGVATDRVYFLPKPFTGEGLLAKTREVLASTSVPPESA